MSEERRALEAYIRELRSSMEGTKGGSEGVGKYYTPYRPVKKRWQDYENCCRRKVRHANIPCKSRFFLTCACVCACFHL